MAHRKCTWAATAAPSSPSSKVATVRVDVRESNAAYHHKKVGVTWGEQKRRTNERDDV
jgi:hypothetical protein